MLVIATSFLPTCSTSWPGPWPRTSADGECTRRNSYGSRKWRPSGNTTSGTREAWGSLTSLGFAPPILLVRLGDDVQVADAREHVAVLRFLALELDVEAQVVQRIGVAQRVLVRDEPRFVEVEQRLVERLHAELAGLLHQVLDAADVALEDQVGHERRIQHDLDRGHAALAVAPRNQALGDERAHVERQVHQEL